MLIFFILTSINTQQGRWPMWYSKDDFHKSRVRYETAMEESANISDMGGPGYFCSQKLDLKVFSALGVDLLYGGKHDIHMEFQVFLMTEPIDFQVFSCFLSFRCGPPLWGKACKWNSKFVFFFCWRNLDFQGFLELGVNLLYGLKHDGHMEFQVFLLMEPEFHSSS